MTDDEEAGEQVRGGGCNRPRAGQRPFLFAVLTWFKCLRERVLSQPPPLALRLFTFNDSQTNHRERGGLGLQHVPRCVCVMCVCVCGCAA